MGLFRRVHRGSVALACALALLVIGHVDSSAQEIFYADSSYTGVPEGTQLRPFSTIAEALAQVEPGRGDTVLVEAGNYNERLQIPAETLLASISGPMATVIRANAAGPAITVSEGAIVQGFRIDAESTAIFAGTGIAADLRNCVVQNAVIGVDARANATLRIDNNTFFNNAVAVLASAGATLASLQNNIFASNNLAVQLDGAPSLNNGYNAFWQNSEAAYIPAVPAETDRVSEPLFVNAANNNFHLRAVSSLRQAGNPAPIFNNRDGSRNTLGADGGPNGVLDLLVPTIALSTTPSPPQGPAPLSVLFNASDSADAWGIAAWEWDFDASDGISVDGFGPSVPFLFDAPGGYLVTLTVRDNSGFESRTQIPVRVGDAPAVSVSVQPPAGKAPIDVRYVYNATGPTILEQDWDVDGDGRIDSRNISPRILWDTDLAPGLYQGALEVTNILNVSTYVPLSFTLTHYTPNLIQELQPGQAANLSLNIQGNPSDGANFVLQNNSIGKGLTLAMSGLAAEDLPFAPPGGSVAAALYVAPAGLRLARMATVELPLPDGADIEGLAVWWLNPTNNEWQTRGIGRVRVDLQARPKVVFETARLGTYAVTVNTFSVPPECGCGASGQSGRGAGGDALVLFLTLAVLTLGARAQRNLGRD